MNFYPEGVLVPMVPGKTNVFNNKCFSFHKVYCCRSPFPTSYYNTTGCRRLKFSNCHWLPTVKGSPKLWESYLSWLTEVAERKCITAREPEACITSLY